MASFNSVPSFLLGNITAIEYTCLPITVVAGSTFANNEVDVGAALKAKYGTSDDIPAFSGFIFSSGSVNMKFNTITDDTVVFDVTLMGNVWTFTRDDFLVDKIFFSKPSSPAEDAFVQVFVTGSPEVLFE